MSEIQQFGDNDFGGVAAPQAVNVLQATPYIELDMSRVETTETRLRQMIRTRFPQGAPPRSEVSLRAEAQQEREDEIFVQIASQLTGDPSTGFSVQ